MLQPLARIEHNMTYCQLNKIQLYFLALLVFATNFFLIGQLIKHELHYTSLEFQMLDQILINVHFEFWITAIWIAFACPYYKQFFSWSLTSRIKRSIAPLIRINMEKIFLIINPYLSSIILYNILLQHFRTHSINANNIRILKLVAD